MKYFQISEDDLATLEKDLPELLSRGYPNLDNPARAMWRRVQKVVMDVRWNYGPPTEVEVREAETD